MAGIIGDCEIENEGAVLLGEVAVGQRVVIAVDLRPLIEYRRYRRPGLPPISSLVRTPKQVRIGGEVIADNRIEGQPLTRGYGDGIAVEDVLQCHFKVVATTSHSGIHPDHHRCRGIQAPGMVG